MQIILKLFPIAFLGLHFLSFASSFSTKWTIKNNSKDPLAISCKNVSVQDVDISMTSKSIKPNKSEVFDWGDNYYNDGLWLNPGKWSCRSKNTPASTNELGNFSTDWGESVTLIVNHTEGKLKLTKVQGNDSNIATKESLTKDRKID